VRLCRGIQALRVDSLFSSAQYCPLARHSPLPELQSLAEVFRPRSLSPNTLIPGYDGCDYYAILGAFRNCLDADSYRNIQAECLAWFRHVRGSDWKPRDLHEAYKIVFRVQEGEASNGEPASERDDIAYLRKNKDAGGSAVLQRSRRANASHQAAAFVASSISGDADSLTGVSPRASIKYDADTVVLDVDADRRPAWIKEESHDKEGVQPSSTADQTAARTRQVNSQTGCDVDLSDNNKARRNLVQSPVGPQYSDAAYSPQPATPNVR